MQALLAECPLTVCFKASVTSALGRTEIKIRGEAPCQSLSAEARARAPVGRVPNVLKTPPVTEPGEFREARFYVFMQICLDR